MSVFPLIFYRFAYTFFLILFFFNGQSIYSVLALDWPQWRGPSRDGTIPNNGLALKYLPEHPKVLWKIKSGEGLASPVVAMDSYFFLKIGTTMKQW